MKINTQQKNQGQGDQVESDELILPATLDHAVRQELHAVMSAFSPLFEKGTFSLIIEEAQNKSTQSVDVSLPFFSYQSTSSTNWTHTITIHGVIKGSGEVTLSETKTGLVSLMSEKKQRHLVSRVKKLLEKNFASTGCVEGEKNLFRDSYLARECADHLNKINKNKDFAVYRKPGRFAFRVMDNKK